MTMEPIFFRCLVSPGLRACPGDRWGGLGGCVLRGLLVWSCTAKMDAVVWKT